MYKMPVNMLRAKRAAAYLGIGESTFWRWVSIGKLPKGIVFSPGVTAWKKEWLDDFITQAADGGKKGDRHE